MTFQDEIDCTMGVMYDVYEYEDEFKPKQAMDMWSYEDNLTFPR